MIRYHPFLISTIFFLVALPGTGNARLVQRETLRPPERPVIARHLGTDVEGNPSERFTAWVLFTDKGVSNPPELRSALDRVENLLPARTMARRVAARGGGPAVGFFDLPVPEEYIHEVLATGATERARSRWLNAVSISATAYEIGEIARFRFVHAVLPVARFTRGEFPVPMPEARSSKPPANDGFQLDYGNSFDQVMQIVVPPLHDLGFSGSGVFIGVLDTGFKKDHQALSGLDIVDEYDFVFDDDDTQYDPTNPDDYTDFHGTGVLSVLAGYAEGELIGPAHGASFFLGKTEDLRSETPIEEDYWVEGLEWMEQGGVDIVSSSLGYTRFEDDTGYQFSDLDGNTAVTTIAADFAAGLGVLVVNAAGNERQSQWEHIITPADGDSVLAIGAVDVEGRIASFSSPGPTYDGRTKPDVCSMGVSTFMALNVDSVSYTRASGTSLATPLVAGASALLLEAHPEWTAENVRTYMRETASRSDSPDNDYGWGVINTLRAADLDVPFVLYLGHVVDDDSTGESLGNGDGFPEGGETVELPIWGVNLGDTSAAGLETVLRTNDPYITILDSVGAFPDLEPDDTSLTNDAHVILLTDTIPPAHTVTFELLITDDENHRWEFGFTLETGRLFAIAGEVTGSDMSPLEGALALVFGPIDSIGRYPIAGILETGSDGRFDSLFLPGVYSVQALKDGFLLSDGFLVTLPPDTSLLFQLESPVLSLDRDSLVFTANGELEFRDTISVTNAGTGILFVGVQEANPELSAQFSGGVGRGGPRRSTSPPGWNFDAFRDLTSGTFDGTTDMAGDEMVAQPVDSLWRLLYPDTDQQTDMDISAMFSQYDAEEGVLYLRLSGWRPWREIPGTWWGGFGIDADANPFTGDESFGGTEYLAIRDPVIGNYLYEWIEQDKDYEVLAPLPYIDVRDSLFEAGIPLELIQLTSPDPELMNVGGGFLFPVWPDSIGLYDAIPVDGGTVFLSLSVHDDSWLTVNPGWKFITSGSTHQFEVVIELETQPVEPLRSSLLFVSNQPLSQPFKIPVVIRLPTGIGDQLPDASLPVAYALSQNYPNPFNPVTSISYDVPGSNGEPAGVLLRIYDMRGRLVRTLVDEEQHPGMYSIIWDGRDDHGEPLASGVYFYRMDSGAFSSLKKMVLLR